MATSLAGTALKDFQTLKKHLGDLGFCKCESGSMALTNGPSVFCDISGNRSNLYYLRDLNGAIWLLKLLSKKEQSLETLLRLMYLRLPNTPKIIRVGEMTEFYWLIEEWIDGVSLCDWIEAKGNWIDFCKIASRICYIVNVCHKEKVLHLDIKQEHFLVNRWNDPFLIDFGTSRGLVDRLNLTQRDLYATPCFVAPELVGEPWRISVEADTYSLAIMLISLCSRFTESKQGVLGHLIRMTHQDPKKRMIDLELLEKEFLKHVLKGIM